MKFLCIRVLLLSCLACCLILVPVVVYAIPYIYTYTGRNFSSIIDDNSLAGAYTTDMRVEVSLITRDGLLPDSTISYDVETYLSSWSFTDGRQTITSSSGFWLEDDLVVTGGEITNWSLWVGDTESDPGVSTTNRRIRTLWYAGQPQTIQGDVGRIEFEEWQVGGSSYVDQGTNRDQRGVWSDPGAVSVPDASIMLLLAPAIIGLARFGRKKFKN
jgi:hypothetical protein